MIVGVENSRVIMHKLHNKDDVNVINKIKVKLIIEFQIKIHTV